MSNYKLIAAAALTAAAILIGGGLFLYESQESEKIEQAKKIERENSIHGFGYIDFEQILYKHSDGAKLKELIGKEIRLRLELNEIMRPVAPPKIPEVDVKPFEESVRERNMHNLISQFAELRARKKRLAEEYRQQTEEEYIKKRNATRDFYMNEAFNITLKLQNANILHLKPEEIEELQGRLNEITLERNLKQKELLDEWTAEIETYVNSQVGEEEERIKKESKELEQKYSEEAMQKIRDTQARNKALMEEAMQEMAFRQTRRRELLDELLKTSKERAELEDAILESIANETGKLGALYKLQMIFIKRDSSRKDETLLHNVELNFKLDSPKPPGTMVFGGRDVKDLTNDLLKTMY